MAYADIPRLTASITLTSPNLTNDSLALTSTNQLNKAGTSTPLDQTTGVGRRTYTSSSIATLFAASAYTDDKAHKIYVRNASRTATEYVLVTVGSQAVGRLYAGDWTLVPWDGTADFKVTPSVATAVTLEYLLLSEV